MRVIVAAIVLAAGLSGCGGAAEDSVVRTADAFGAALGRGDADAACELLAPHTRDELERSARAPCPQALLD